MARDVAVRLRFGPFEITDWLGERRRNNKKKTWSTAEVWEENLIWQEST